MDSVTIYAASVEEITINDPKTIAVTLEDVDLPQLIQEIGATELLDAIGKDEIVDYLENSDED